MNSKVINKLIRSEIWPVLREQGFTGFSSRDAYAYVGPFINVVNFQSFNSYNASVLECTTFSFVVNLGVYIKGSPGNQRVKRDTSGKLMPHEYECSFRTSLRKRSSIDGFARDDVFFIDPLGNTVAACFRETTSLLSDVAPQWFKNRNDIDHLLVEMHIGHAPRTVSRDARFDSIMVPGSYSWKEVRATLAMLKHSIAPSPSSADVAVETMDQVIGSRLNFSVQNDSYPGQESDVAILREVWDGLGGFAPVPACCEGNDSSNLTSDVWRANTGQVSYEEPLKADSDGLQAPKQFWPSLKARGFTEFTQRLAHRILEDRVEVVEILPMDRYECKIAKLPTGLFRVGIGVFWLPLQRGEAFRVNKENEPRPRVAECHLSNWMTPEYRRSTVARTAFDRVQDAQTMLHGAGFHWFEQVTEVKALRSLFSQHDWEIFWCYPMMRGHGSKDSVERYLIQAYLAKKMGMQEEMQRYLEQARTMSEQWEQWLHYDRSEFYAKWIPVIQGRLTSADSA